MSIKNCKECKKEVSTKADSCPHCGAKQKKNPIGCLGITLILIIISIFGTQLSNYWKKAEENKKTTQEAIQEKETIKKKNEKRSNDILNFEKTIDTHYADLIKLIEENKKEDALIKIALFQEFNKSDYKDIKKHFNNINTEVLLEKVKSIPATEVEENLSIYKELLQLNPEQTTYKSKVEYYQKNHDKEELVRREMEYKASCQLEIINTRWFDEYGFVTYEGLVKNISNSRLENIRAVVTWYDKNDIFITSSKSIIEYNPILPGQSSPFKVMAKHNPAMNKAGVEFSSFGGGIIKTYIKK